MPNSQKGFVLPLVIAIVAILAIGGTVYLAESQKPEMSFEIDIDSTETTSTASTTVVDTSGWKTYENFDRGLEFKYPSEYTIVREEADYVMFRDLNVKTGVGNDDPGKMIIVYFRSGDNPESVMCRKIDIMCVHSIKEDTLKTLDQRKVMSYTVTRHDLGGDIGFIVNKDNSFILIETTQRGTGASEARADISTIVSSLRFVDRPEPDKPRPIIYSIVPSHGFVGTTITIQGLNLAGFEGDKNIWIKDINSGAKGLIHGDSSSTDNHITFKLADRYCASDVSYSGLECPSYLNIKTTDYILYVEPWGVKSNEVKFSLDRSFVPVACTADAKLCPDGTYVGRSGPKCEFVCPTVVTGREVKIGQTILDGDIRITPLEIMEDSRCPLGVTCVWAGTVKLKVRLSNGLESKELIILVGKQQGVSFANTIVSFSVTPEKTTDHTISTSEYTFRFFVSPTTQPTN
jgi:hypothetical protein